MAPSGLALTPAQSYEVRLTLGPMQIGNFLNAILFGVLCIQVSQYFGNFRDPLWIRSLVILAFLIDFAQTALMMYMTWEYSVTHYADFTFLSASIWTLCSIPFFSVPVSWIVQGAVDFTHGGPSPLAVYHNGFDRLAFLILLLAFHTVPSRFPPQDLDHYKDPLLEYYGAFGIYAGVGSFFANTTAENVTLQKIAIVWFIFGMLCDVSIMVIMIWSLNQSKTGFKDTDNLITRINRSVLETGAATSATVLVDCLLLFLVPGTDMHLVPVMAVGKVYSNSFLYLLNSRGTYRKVSTMRLGTSDFARSLDRNNNDNNIISERPTNRTAQAGRGLQGMRFATNEDVFTTGSKSTNHESDTTNPAVSRTASGVYLGIAHDTYAMSNLSQQESAEDINETKYKPAKDDSKPEPLTITIDT
ncbi:hypothetical protein DL93DRAFT_2171899 [Clavulina sp. PMI_390]|nr:hypothetical protein DL93DRAFT_2171899 [Clavulina sp. PMI_390]